MVIKKGSSILTKTCLSCGKFSPNNTDGFGFSCTKAVNKLVSLNFCWKASRGGASQLTQSASTSTTCRWLECLYFSGMMCNLYILKELVFYQYQFEIIVWASKLLWSILFTTILSHLAYKFPMDSLFSKRFSRRTFWWIPIPLDHPEKPSKISHWQHHPRLLSDKPRHLPCP